MPEDLDTILARSKVAPPANELDAILARANLKGGQPPVMQGSLDTIAPADPTAPGFSTVPVGVMPRGVFDAVRANAPTNIGSDIGSAIGNASSSGRLPSTALIDDGNDLQNDPMMLQMQAGRLQRSGKKASASAAQSATPEPRSTLNMPTSVGGVGKMITTAPAELMHAASKALGATDETINSDTPFDADLAPWAQAALAMVSPGFGLSPKRIQNVANTGAYFIPGVGQALMAGQALQIGSSVAKDPAKAASDLYHGVNPFEPGIEPEERLMRAGLIFLGAHGLVDAGGDLLKGSADAKISEKMQSEMGFTKPEADAIIDTVRTQAKDKGFDLDGYLQEQARNLVARKTGAAPPTTEESLRQRMSSAPDSTNTGADGTGPGIRQNLKPGDGSIGNLRDRLDQESTPPPDAPTPPPVEGDVAQRRQDLFNQIKESGGPFKWGRGGGRERGSTGLEHNEDFWRPATEYAGMLIDDGVKSAGELADRLSQAIPDLTHDAAIGMAGAALASKAQLAPVTRSKKSDDEDSLVAQAAATIREQHAPIFSANDSDEHIANTGAAQTVKEVEEWRKKNPQYQSFYTTDTKKADDMATKFAEETHGRTPTPAELDLFHYLSAMGSPSASPLTDSMVGLGLFDRYLKTGQISPYIKDAEHWEGGIHSPRAGTGIYRVDPGGKVAAGKDTLAYEDESVNRLNDLVHGHFGGDLAATMNWLKSEHPVAEIEKVTGRELPKHEYAKPKDRTFGVFGIAGVKLGSYFLNRRQILDTVTKDLWYARNMARWQGEPLVDKSGKPIKEPWSEGTNGGRRMRALMDEAWRKAGEKLGMAPALIQEALWDAEQNLYQEHGAPRTSGPISEGTQRGINRVYENAILKELRSGGDESAIAQKYPHIDQTLIAETAHDERTDPKHKWGKVYEPYQQREATTKERRDYSVWKSLAELRRDLYGAKSVAASNGNASHSESGLRGYAELPRRSSRYASVSGRLNLPAIGKSVKIKRTFEPTDTVRSAFSSFGATAQTFHEIEGPSQFAALVKHVYLTDKFGQCVTPFTPAEYAGLRLFVNADSNAFFALRGDEVISAESMSKGTMAAHSMLLFATELGARRLDCFDTILPDIYAECGFRAVSRTPFDTEYEPDKFKRKWNEFGQYNRYNNGQPDVVFMVYDPDKIHAYEPGTGKSYDSYDEAQAAQVKEVISRSKSIDAAAAKQKSGYVYTTDKAKQTLQRAHEQLLSVIKEEQDAKKKAEAAKKKAEADRAVQEAKRNLIKTRMDRTPKRIQVQSPAGRTGGGIGGFGVGTNPRYFKLVVDMAQTYLDEGHSTAEDILAAMMSEYPEINRSIAKKAAMAVTKVESHFAQTPGANQPAGAPKIKPAPSSTTLPSAAQAGVQRYLFERLGHSTSEGSLRSQQAAREYAAKNSLYLAQAETAFNEWRKNLDGRKDAWDIVDRIERGVNQKTAEDQEAAKFYRKIMDRLTSELQSRELLHTFNEDYFPHVWEEKDKGGLFSRKPLEGSKSFQKARTIATIKEGMDAGLTPKYDNPADMVAAKIVEMNKAINAYDLRERLKDSGDIKYIAFGGRKAPEGWLRLNDSMFEVKGPRTVDVPQFYDKGLMDALHEFADQNGIDIHHVENIQTNGRTNRKAAGVATGTDVMTKFNTTESVLTHEVAHAIDYKHKLRDKLEAKLGDVYNEETAALADLRDPLDEGGPEHKAYLNEAPERFANLIHAMIHVPQLAEMVAPESVDAMRSLAARTPGLKELFDISPSLELGGKVNPITVPGLRIMGAYYAPPEVAKILNNFTSSGIQNGLFKNVVKANNAMTMVKLSLSAFHFTATTIYSMASQMALGIQQISQFGDGVGRVAQGLGNVGLTAAAPVLDIIDGTKFMKQVKSGLDFTGETGAVPADIQEKIDALIKAGGRINYTPVISEIKGRRELAQAIKRKDAKGVARSLVPTLIETMAAPIMDFWVPRLKVGAFYKLYQSEMQHLGKGAGPMEIDAMARRVWDSIDNRYGQLVHDNLFWSKTAKQVMGATFLSTGWNLGSARELGGGAADAARDVLGGAALKGKGLSVRTSFVVGLTVTVAILGSIYYYLHHGTAPDNLKDAINPPTGMKNGDGTDERVQFPTILKDALGLPHAFFQTIIHKFSPMIQFVVEQLNNKDFEGEKIAYDEDPVTQRVADRLKHFARQYIPISVSQSGHQKQVTGTSSASNFFGVTPAPAWMSRTPALNALRDVQFDQLKQGGSTKEEATRMRDMQTLRAMIMNKQDSAAGDLAAKMVKGGEAKLSTIENIVKSTSKPPVAALFDQVSKDITLSQALHVYDVATDDEKSELSKSLQKILIAKVKSDPSAGDRVDAFIKQHRELSGSRQK